MSIVGAISLEANTGDAVKAAQAAINAGRHDVRRFATGQPKPGIVAIVGGGPSLADHLEELRRRKSQGQLIWATNDTFAYLTANGIMPDAHVILDSRADNIAFLHPAKGVTYYLHVSCHPSLFDLLAGHDVVMYDLGSVASGTTVGLKALYLAAFSGYRTFALNGFDSSYSGDDRHHAYRQELNDKENVIEVVVDGVKFKAAPWMMIQAEEFQSVARSLAGQDCVLTVHGYGLLPFIAKQMARNDRVLTAVWDLAVCPPTYDITSFLGEAERKRKEIGARWIDLVIQPGPIGGFRYDDLPPNLGARVGMLYRVNLAMARLLPSIRNVEVRKTRRAVEDEDIFPVGYQESEPTNHYGPSFLNRAEPIFEATEAARAMVARYRTGKRRPYITITLRQASHWPSRNSNLQEWDSAAAWLRSRGYDIEWVPDTESPDCNMFSWDLDLRLALYEGAAINLGVNNGPTCMWLYCDIPFIIFKMVTEEVPWTSTAFFERFGIKPGAIGRRGWLVFEPDTHDVITTETARYLNIPDLRMIGNA